MSNKYNNILLVDTSYTTFHRFFATIRWFSFANKDVFKEHKDDNKFDWSLEPTFIEKYTKMYLESIINLVSKKIFNDSIVIFCQDAPSETLWRHEIAECYKGNRLDLSEKYNFKPTFKYTFDILIPKLIKENKNIHSLLIPRMEADDLIALATKFIKYKRPNKTTYIISGDNDFLQLGHDKLYIADYKKDYLIHLTKEEAREALRQKIVSGDCSDNIPSIFKDQKINNKTKKLVKEDKKEMKTFLKENSMANNQYNINKRMISFRYILKHFRKPVYKSINKLILL
jgi:5'-3' exonuclease